MKNLYLILFLAFITPISIISQELGNGIMLEVKKKNIITVNKKLTDDKRFEFIKSSNTIATNFALTSLNLPADVLGNIYSTFYFSPRLHIIEKNSSQIIWSSQDVGLNTSGLCKMDLLPTGDNCLDCNDSGIYEGVERYYFDVSSFIESIPLIKYCDYLNSHFIFKVEVQLIVSSPSLLPLSMPISNSTLFNGCSEFWPNDCFTNHFIGQVSLTDGVICIDEFNGNSNTLSEMKTDHREVQYSEQKSLQLNKCYRWLAMSSIDGRFNHYARGNFECQELHDRFMRNNYRYPLIIIESFCDGTTKVQKIAPIE